MSKTTLNTFNEENIAYLRNLLGSEKVDTFLTICDSPEKGNSEEQRNYKIVKNCLDTMEKFGDNRWWVSKDKKVLGYYQLMIPILLIPFDMFHEALEFLVGHPVFTCSMNSNNEELKAEAERAFKVGTQNSSTF